MAHIHHCNEVRTLCNYFVALYSECRRFTLISFDTRKSINDIDSLGKYNCNIIKRIPVDPNQSHILFTKTNDYAFTTKDDCIDPIRITASDDPGEPYGWNNQDCITKLINMVVDFYLPFRFVKY